MERVQYKVNVTSGEAEMKKRLAYTTVLVLAAALSTSGSAQTLQVQDRQVQSRDTSMQDASVRQTTPRLQTRQTQRFERGLAVATLQQRQPTPPPRPDAPQIVPINWDQVQADLRQQSAANSNFTAGTRLVQRFPQPTNEAAGGVVQTRLPVLSPPLAVLGFDSPPQVMLFPQENFYTLSITGDDILIEVFGTRLAHIEPPDPASARRLLATGPSGMRVTRAEYGVDVNLNRYGAAYSVSVECDDPEGDSRCSELDYARQIAESLGIVGGTPDEGE